MFSLDISDLLIFLIGIVSFVFIYGKWEDGEFKRRGIKSPPTRIPFLGHLTDPLLGRKHFTEVLKDAYDLYPKEKYFGFKQFRAPSIVVKDLELIKRITIKDFDYFQDHQVFLDWDTEPLLALNLFSLNGQQWKEMRPKLSPAFTSSKMRGMFEFVTECAEQTATYYLDEMKKPQNIAKGFVDVDLKDVFTRYANDVIATCAFGIKVDSLKERENEFYTNGGQAVGFSSLSMLKLFLLSSIPYFKELTRVPVLPEGVKIFFKSLVLSSIDMRERQNIIRPDIIHLLMEAKKGKQQKKEREVEDEKDSGFATAEEFEVGNQVSSLEWTDDTLVANALVFFLAGFDTSSTLQSFMAYELAANTDIQRKLQHEIDEVAARTTGRVSYKDIHSMKYMDMVTSESLRYWPPATRLERKCVKTYKLPPSSENSQEITVNVNEGILIPLYAIHRDPEYYENPDKFDPERFSEENRGKINPLTYMPFGLGPRNCVGSRFALMEAKAIIFYLLLNFNLVPTERTQIPLKLQKNKFFITPEKGFWVGLKSRK